MKRIALVLLVAGCATQERFEDLSDMQIGMTESQIIDRLGPPAAVHEAGGARYLTWSAEKQTAPIYRTVPLGYSTMTVPMGGGTLTCALTYKMEPREVVDLTAGGEPGTTDYVATSYTYKGNNCRD